MSHYGPIVYRLGHELFMLGRGVRLSLGLPLPPPPRHVSVSRSASPCTVHNRREAAKFISDEKILNKLFTEIGPRMKERNGGYTRVLKLGFRQGDAADVVILELVDYKLESEDEKAEKKAAKKPAAKKTTAKAKKAE